MERNPAYQSLGNALEALRIAEFEMNRPSEDVVTPCSCHFARQALNGLLRTYLLKHKTDVDPNLNSDELLQMCANFDTQFNTVNLSSFVCRIHNGDSGDENLFCLSVEKVNDCLRTTHRVKDLVMEKLLPGDRLSS